MQAVAAHRDYTRIFHNCQANNETFSKKLSYFLSTIPYAKLLHSPHIRRNSPSRGISLPNSLTDFFEHSCSRQPMKAPKFLMGLVATLSGCREARTLKGFVSPSGFQDRLLTNSHYTLFLSTVVNRRTFSPSRLKQFYKSPHDSYHDYKRNNFSNLAGTEGFEPSELFIIVRLVSNEFVSANSRKYPNSRHDLIDLNYLIM